MSGTGILQTVPPPAIGSAKELSYFFSMNKWLQDIWDALRSPMISFTFIVGLIMVVVILLLDTIFRPTYKELLIEAHGMIFDLLMFGIVLGVYDLVLRRREEGTRDKIRREDLINRYREEIEDYRGWKSEEAMFRTVGNIKRLNSLGITYINLENAYLNKSNLREVKLVGAWMQEVRLVEADLRRSRFNQANLQRAFLNSSNLGESQLSKADLTGATLVSARLERAELMRTNLSEARLANANLSEANLQEAACRGADFSFADLTGADLRQADFSNADLGNADLRGAKFEGIQLEGADLGEAIFSVEQRELLERLGVKDLGEIQFVD
jgi:hypothetical protein